MRATFAATETENVCIVGWSVIAGIYAYSFSNPQTNLCRAWSVVLSKHVTHNGPQSGFQYYSMTPSQSPIHHPVTRWAALCAFKEPSKSSLVPINTEQLKVCCYCYSSTEIREVVTSGAGIVNSSGSPEFTPIFSDVRVAWSLVFCVQSCRSLFVVLFFFFWSLCCLSFDLGILTTPLLPLIYY